MSLENLSSGEGGRNDAVDLLKLYAIFEEGTFLVRESDTFVGEFLLSFRETKSADLLCHN